jgi:hypothetical protein
MHATTGFGDACAPSAIGLLGAAFPVLWASQGYLVAAPDLLGMNGWGAPSDQLHPWLVGEPAALAGLDSLRATRGLAEELGTAATPDLSRTLVIGASQGGHGALFADHYAAGYAPEVGVVGVVAVLPPTDMVDQSIYGATTDTTATEALSVAVVANWAWHREAADLHDVLLPEYAETFPDLLDGLCANIEVLFEGLDSAADVLTPALRDAAAAGSPDGLDPWACYAEESSLLRNVATGGVVSSSPKLLLTGSLDDLVWAPIVRADAERLCEAGSPVTYVECSDLGHTLSLDPVPLLLSWMLDRVEGVPADRCDLRPPAPCVD